MAPTLPLETARLRLRRFAAGDAPLLFDLGSDPEVMRFITQGGAALHYQIAAWQWYEISGREARRSKRQPGARYRGLQWVWYQAD